MNDKKVYQEKRQAQLDGYELKLKELKDEISEFDAESNRKLDKQIKILESEIKDARTKLDAFSKANNEEIESCKKAVEDTFIAINTNLSMS